ncbi:hypothetical protein PPERSA_12026 [Pseudocohnilembus persalinus]|uniref:Uncharacterized protein n=1 Tax=Pseudocohnilembus persalinus TaxID=266149 RepID=A0A0V0R8S9_PSEPJ|nr:hypothetical protein PPERSA_12026 [Pseudocohnilembus persalinus]|eukprot:KRX10902.1 hypothetical protein PPERSA_12026 [Pseudocohnilembus persalinus]
MGDTQKWDPQVQPDFGKLNKLDKLLLKIDQDIQKRIKDQDQIQYMETLKKTHDIYQLVLGELQYQLGELELNQYGKIILKIFTGQNTLLNILLKMRTNLDFNPDTILEGLADMQRKRKNMRRNSFGDTKDQNFNEVKNQMIPGYKFGKIEKLDLDKPVRMFKDAFTDTNIDQEEARNPKLIQKKLEELEQIKNDFKNNKDDVKDFLQAVKANTLDLDPSNADKQLKSVLKDLNKKRKDAELLELEGENLLRDEEDIRKNLGNFGDSLKNNMNNKNNQNQQVLPQNLAHNQRIVDGKIVTIEQITNSTMTDPDRLLQEMQKMKIEQKANQRNLQDLEKKMKQVQREADIKHEQLQKSQQKLQEAEFQMEKMRKEDKKKSDESQKHLVMGENEKDKFKKLTEENIRMKLKLKELLDTIMQLDQENKDNMKNFRNFIMSDPSLTEEQKRRLLGKVEDLFTSKISSKINMRELEQMSKIDANMLKDKFIKDALGGDPLAIIKNIKQQEKQKQLNRQKVGYNPDFDPELLGENEAIVKRKIKKKIKRLNSQGQWEEIEVEVEEEVVIDKLTGKQIRKREIEQPGPKMDPTMHAFLNKHGGMAVAGAKFKKPEMPGKRPVRKDGQPVVEGEWFEDENGKKVRMIKDKNGNEFFEQEEEYTDENGNVQKRVKKMKFKKDQYGNDVTEEEYVDPKTGQKVKIEKRVLKDKDGNKLYEEVTTDEFGNKTIKRTKVKKDKDGNEIIEDEYTDQYGYKKIVKTKVTKDKNGKDIITQEIINEDGTKTVITEKFDEFGNKIITKEIINKDGTKTIVTEKVDQEGNKTVKEEFVDKKGNKKVVKEKKMKMGADGKIQIEETVFGKNGKPIKKNIRVEQDKDGNQVQIEETEDENGNKFTKTTKKIKDEDGNEVIVEESTDQFGNKITKTKKQIIDEDGNQVIVEETLDSNGNKITKKTKKFVDKEGNEVVEEEIVGSDGKKMIVRKKINKDGTVEEEYIDPKTGEKKIIKRKIDKDGKEIVEETVIDKNGKKTVSTKVISKDKNGNAVVQETFIDKNGKIQNTVKKITKGKDGQDIIEEITTDANGKQINKKINKYKDKDGNDITEEETIGADGKKQKIKRKEYVDQDGKKVMEEEVIGADGKISKVMKKEYTDQDGNKIIEEEIIDENGNKVIRKRKINQDGSESVEETKIGKNGKKEVTRKEINKDGMVKETKINADGTVETKIYKNGFDDKAVQTGSTGPIVSSLEDCLRNMGLTDQQIQIIAEAIRKYIQTGEPIILGDEDMARLKLEKAHHDKQLAEFKKQKTVDSQSNFRKQGKKVNDSDDEDLEVLDDDQDEDVQMEKLYKNMKSQGGQVADLQRAIRNQLGLNGDQEIDLNMFKEYVNKLKQVHGKCGENCPHLKRWYARLGFTLQKYKRRFLKMKDAKIKGFERKLPKI